MKYTAGMELVSYLRDQVRLPESSEVLAARYKSAAPYPHLILDEVFPEELLRSLTEEMTLSDSKNWIHHDTERINKYGSKSAIGLGETGFTLLSYLHSANFLYILSEVTGIWNLLPDPYLHGAGYSIIPPGGKFDVHADRNYDPQTSLTRRLAMIIYLNRDWRPEYGGQLELWDKSASQCVAKVEPIFNRLILMEIEDGNYHGIPKVVAPEGRSRHSFMVYYNTAGAPVGKEGGVHGSIYAPRCYEEESAIRKLAKNITPPILFNYVRKKIV
ncbi:2OG-Fe(II) oxygenase [Acidipila rosea]|uniref:Rps23 Pro-64 3,4-dihydroxylase Tpa1-like proline 4-hydroxylase n=1 Tax=Acidipila rosea TaxID=768535 RepID=A0A4R1LDJ3_9BACT|nr:2OG-Fe(II) oxygenase [Acidipila rosea]TCK75797.1 Rps23 Pro-64 3,4-dihydroxylase Tpa1-like proline 4-hydroxylase [Acidipila rosea]